MLLPFVTSFMAMSYCCIKGTKQVIEFESSRKLILYVWFYSQRDHEQVKSMLAYLGFAAMVSFACVFSFIIPAVIVGSILGLIFAYFFTVIYSLHDIFKLEQKRDCNRNLKRQSSFWIIRTRNIFYTCNWC